MTSDRVSAGFADAASAYQEQFGRRCPVYLRSWLDGKVGGAERSELVGVVIYSRIGAEGEVDDLSGLRVDLHPTAQSRFRTRLPRWTYTWT